MIDNLDEKRKKDLAYYTKLTLNIKFLPKIMQYLQNENQDKQLKEIIQTIIEKSNINLNEKNKERIFALLKSSYEKGMTYKTFKRLKEVKLKKAKEKTGYYYENNKIEKFITHNIVINTTLKKLKEDVVLSEEIKKETSIIIKEYIKTVLSEDEKNIVRRR